MIYKNLELVSLNEAIRLLEPSKKQESYLKLTSHFILVITSLYRRDGSVCLKAEASDKTRHLLVELSLILEILTSNSFKLACSIAELTSILKALKSQQFNIIDGACCCCPKKMKKAFQQVESFSTFVRQGEVELRRFTSIRPGLKTIICLDIEVFESDHSKILEIGLSLLETQTKTVSTVHLIISDFMHLKNGRFIPNNRSKFNFGKSFVKTVQESIKYVAALLNRTDVCLLGHNVRADVQYLNKISNVKFDLPIFDTQQVHKERVVAENVVSLAKLLDELNIPYSNLHNAGNDAHYTLSAFRKLADI